MTLKEIKITPEQLMEEKIRILFNKWIWMITKFGWEYKIRFYYKMSDLPSNLTEAADMGIRPDHELLSAEIMVNLERCIINNSTDRDLEEYVVHELMHALLSPLKSYPGAPAEEHVVTTLARLFLDMDKEISHGKES